MSPDNQWIPIILWPRAWPSIAGLRQRIAALERSGGPVPFARRLGRRVLVSPARWDAWIEAQAATPGSAHEAA